MYYINFVIAIILVLLASFEIDAGYVRCSNDYLPGGIGGSVKIPTARISIDNTLCNLASLNCGTMSYKDRTYLKGPGKCDGAVFWVENDKMQFLLKDGWRQWCTPSKSCGTLSVYSGSCECTINANCNSDSCGYWSR